MGELLAAVINVLTIILPLLAALWLIVLGERSACYLPWIALALIGIINTI